MQLRNHDGLGKASSLQRGMPIFPLHEPLRDVIRTAKLLRACVWYDAGTAVWREGEYVVSHLMEVAIYLGNN